MPTLMRKILHTTLESPGLKTLISVSSTVAAGVLTGTFVAEIATDIGFEWSSFYKTYSFYALLLLTGLLYCYNRAVYLHDKQVLRFIDSDFCIAYMRSKCLPEAAERYKLMIREGQGGELTKAMDELKNILR